MEQEAKKEVKKSKRFNNVCPECGCVMQPEGGCAICLSCGYSHCH